MHTVMGVMIRQLLAPTRLHTDKDPFLPVLFCLVDSVSHQMKGTVWLK